eukprot:Nitzschia sp. Nitz4//scaffold432_size7799//5704//7479//NITZ4_009148-RA/size7799-augustus-gene-0.28-mRNA-1//-1//CDS//3329551820//5778//frame0
MRPPTILLSLWTCLWLLLSVGSACGNVPRGGSVASKPSVVGMSSATLNPSWQRRRPWSPLSIWHQGTNAKALLPANEVPDQRTPSPTTETETSPPTTSSFVSKLPLTEVGGIAILTAIQHVTKRLFAAYQIDFPPMLGGCLGLVAFLLLADFVVQPGLGESINRFLLPGSLLLSKWFPVLFLPSLVLLPLAPSLGDGWEVAKFLSVVIIGFLYTFLLNVFAVQWTQQMVAGGAGSHTSISEHHQPTRSSKEKLLPTNRPVSAPKPKLFDDATMSFLLRSALVSTASVMIVSYYLGNEEQEPTSRLVMSRLKTCMDLCTSFTAYVWASRLPSKLTASVHPIMISSMLQVMICVVKGQLTGGSLVEVLHTYKTGSLHWKKAGAADIMTFFLGPSVVSFATALFARRRLVWSHVHFVLVASVISSVGGLFGTAWLVRFVQLKEATARISSLPRSVTTALAIPCVTMLGGDVSLTVLIVVLTGAFGATYGRTLLNAMSVQDPTIRGLAIGGAAQGLGVASLSSEPDAYPFAAITMILTAILSTTLVSIHPIKDLLVHICLGKN